MAEELKGKITEDTVKAQMEELGVYRAEFDNIIEIYVSIVTAHDKLYKEWLSKGCPYEVESESGGAKRAPIVQTLDAMQKNIIAYADRLGLSPRAINNLKTKSKADSKFDKSLKLLSGDASVKKKAK